MAASTCRTCRARITWARSVPGGRRVPLDPHPVAAGSRGAFAVIESKGELWAYSPDDLAARMAARGDTTARRALEHIERQYPFHTSHFATCPHADQHRRHR